MIRTHSARAAQQDSTEETWDTPRTATGPQQDLHDFRLAGWLVQPSLDRLTCDGVVVRIRPQLMDILVCLAARAGRTVMRNELVATVWWGRFAVDTGLSRCVAELRHALGDSARQPRIIETVTKRGYRLIAPVVTAPAPLRAVEHVEGGKGNGRSAARDVGFTAARSVTAAGATPRPSRLDRVISRLRIVAIAFGARLVKGRPARSAAPGGMGTKATTGGARAL